MANTERLLAAIQAFLQVSNDEGLTIVFQKYPELLDENIDSVLVALITNNRKQGETELTRILEQCHQKLKKVRSEFKEFITYQTTIQQAQIAEQRYLNNGNNDVSALDEAIQIWERLLHHPNFASTKVEYRLVIVNNSAITYLRRYNAKGNLSDLTAALDAWEQAIALTLPSSPELPTIFSNLGTGLTDRYMLSGNPLDLQRSIEAFQRAIALTPTDSRELPSRLNNLGTGLINRYSQLGSFADLQAGIEAYEKTITLTSPDDFTKLPSRLNNFGSGLWLRYACLADIEDLRRSIEVYEEAVALTLQHSPDSPELPPRFNNLGTGLMERYMRFGKEKDLKRSIEVCEQAVALTLPNSTNFSGYLTNLAKGLWLRYAYLADIEDLRRSIEVYEQAVALTLQYSPDSPELPSRLNSLGIGLIDRYIQFGELIDLQRSIEVKEKAVALTPSNSPELSSRLNSLGVSLSNRYTRSGSLEDLQQGIEAFRKAIQQKLVAPLEHCLRAARNWLNWAFERSSWQEMAEAYPRLKATSDTLVATQLRREHQEAFLKDTEGLAVKMAYAYLQLNQIPDAVEVIEQGVARLLSAALMRSRADLNQLQRDALGLATAYQQQVTTLQNAERAYQHAPTERQAAFLQDLRNQRTALDTLLQQIRQLKGHEHFLQIATNMDTVYQAAQETPLVYLFTTAKGGYALVVFQGEVQAVVLPELTDESLRQEVSSYFKAYDNQQQNSAAWYQVIDNICQWLWQVLWQPLREKLPNQPHITLIPVGWLNLLPLHAAWTADPTPTQPTGRRYALDEVTIAYAPNAVSLQKARELATHIPSDKLLAIDEPKPVKANLLRNSSVEVNAIARHFSPFKLLRHEDAKLETVKQFLNSNYNVLHFSCHGDANFENPLETGLLMANYSNEDKDCSHILTVQDFFDAKLKARLATLSACETGMIGTKTIEEVVGLPTSLLQAGVAGVVASLWLVSDLSTALLLIRFYENFMNQPDNTAKALNVAQKWLRQLTRADAEIFFNEKLLPHIEILYHGKPATKKWVEEQWQAFLNKGGDYPFKSPYHWAAFTATGV